jgi:hypothetical protein
MGNKNRQQFERRFEALRIPKSELDRMYERELEYQLHMQWMTEQAMAIQQGSAVSPPGGGLAPSASCPNPLLLTVDTSAQSGSFDMEVDLSADTGYTFIWGDGNVDTGTLSSGSGVSISHTYADDTLIYSAQLCFTDPSVVTLINIYRERIRAFSNLQQFTNLLEFEADDNYLVSADFSGMSSLIDINIGDSKFSPGGADSLTSVNLTGCVNLEILELDDSDFSGGLPSLAGLNNLRYIDVDDCAISGTVDLSTFLFLERIDFSQNLGLTSLTISSAQPLGGVGNPIMLYDCALTEASVDSILVALDGNGIIDGYVDLSNQSGGTNSAPSAIGLAAATSLIGKGWVVIVAP